MTDDRPDPLGVLPPAVREDCIQAIIRRCRNLPPTPPPSPIFAGAIGHFGPPAEEFAEQITADLLAVLGRHFLRDLMGALGWPDVARPQSPAELWERALAEVRGLSEWWRAVPAPVPRD